MRAWYLPYRLYFSHTVTTSRTTMQWKDTWLVRLHDEVAGRTGVGECGMFAGLSCDDVPDYERRLVESLRMVKRGVVPDMSGLPSVAMGIESALGALKQGSPWTPFYSDFSRGEGAITINGLVWMGSWHDMMSQLEHKLDQGFRCIKIKVGALDFDSELSLLASLRQRFRPDETELRLDANGAFTADNVMERLDALAQFGIHSIEQPVRAGNYELMARVAAESPIPIALDEELIGLNTDRERREMLDAVKPQYIILKPTLHGGFSGCDRWIELAGERGIGWWATSALESGVGLNDIACWVAAKGIAMPQGLGTGEIYVNNIISPVRRFGEQLRYDTYFNDPGLANLPWIEVG